MSPSVLCRVYSAWAINRLTQKKIEAVEMWFGRRMLRIKWTAKEANMEEARHTKSLVNRRTKQQAASIGQIIRRECLEHLITTGELET